jgi:hypothetical protein
MSLKNERKVWRWLGASVLVLGMVIMIAGIAMLFDDDDILNKLPSRVQALGTAVALCGMAALVLSRILGLLVDSKREPNGLWAAVSYGALILGLVGGSVDMVIWNNSVRSGLQDAGGFSPWQKSGLLGAGFLVMIGVIALIGERTARLYVKYKGLQSGAAGAGR